MYGSERPMGPVPCIAVKGLWDRSHAWLLDKHGTGPIGQLGLHIMTWTRRLLERADQASGKLCLRLSRSMSPHTSEGARDATKVYINLQF